MLRQKLKRLENYGHQDECRFNLKPQLIVIVAAVLLLGCGNPDGALIQAAKDGNIEAVKQHLAAGADVNAKSRTGTTPLHLATWGHTKIIELLIANGADVNAKANGGITPLDYPMSNNDKKIAALIRKHGGKTGEELKTEGK